jgi:hypothetical protein
LQPTYLIASSSGPSLWKVTNWDVTPFNMSFSAISPSTCGYQIEITLDNPVAYSPAGANAAGGMVQNPSSQAPLVNVLSSLTIGNSSIIQLTFPVAAWRVNITSSYCGSPVIASAIQAGQKQ